ncbi:MAG: hypothetical protein PHX74_04650 [Candidatus Sumerlaeales bacterium]|nr:hypothetical protein [Candidatus Sumerlaeales bacterium]
MSQKNNELKNVTQRQQQIAENRYDCIDDLRTALKRVCDILDSAKWELDDYKEDIKALFYTVDEDYEYCRKVVERE